MSAIEHLKISMFGATGSGKTFTSLLIAEGLHRIEGGPPPLFIDTEDGARFYTRTVRRRAVHPEAFEVNRTVTTDLLKVEEAILNNESCCVVVDSVSGLWQGAIDAYTGPMVGQNKDKIPIHAWGGIKAPYKRVIDLLCNKPFHAIVCGRETLDLYDDEVTGETLSAGTKMQAEKNTQYEFDVCLHMTLSAIKGTKKKLPTMLITKDRTGILDREFYRCPTFEQTVGQVYAELNGVPEAAGESATPQPDSPDLTALQDEVRKAAFSTGASEAVLNRRVEELYGLPTIYDASEEQLRDLLERIQAGNRGGGHESNS